MTFSLNQQFEELVKTTLSEKQMITDNNNNNNSNNTDNNEEITVIGKSTRRPDFPDSIISILKEMQEENIP